jgi:FKBP-type peptidyl-prolyl cis-trans isomerase FklB
MNTKTSVFAILTSILTATGLQAEDTNLFKSDKEKVGYAVGVNLGMNWKRQEIDLDFEQLLRGLKDSTSGGKTLLSEQEVREVLNKFQQELTAKQQEKRRLKGRRTRTRKNSSPQTRPGPAS